MKRAVLALLLLLPAIAATPAAAGAESPLAATGQGVVGLLAATTGVGAADRAQLGLSFDLKPGWHVYWRSPGAAGFPPALDWSGSDNLAGATIAWPAPRRFVDSGLETYGYEGQVVLPLAVRLKQAGQPLVARLSVNYLVCKDICIPKQIALQLALPAGPALPGPDFQTIARFQEQVPGDGRRDGLALVSAEATPDGRLRVVVRGDPPLSHPDLIVERADQLQFAAPRVRLGAGGTTATLETAPVAGSGQDGKPGAVAGSRLTLTVLDGARRMEVAAVAAPMADPALWPIVAVALLGGLILNLMPCVLPVLALKLLAAVGAAGAERRRVRGRFLATAAGVVVSFLALAAVVLVVRAAGGAVGWGVQFQQPAFLAAMGMVMVLFGASLVGLFEIPLPAWAGEHGMRGGAFAGGMFATLLATPCSAPFVGTALGFALARGPVEIVAIFAALGVGMALPYLAVAAVPSAVAWLPRPGSWMVWLRRVLGLALFATAAWLVTLISAEAGVALASFVAMIMLVVPQAFVISRRWAPGRRALLVAIPALAAPLAAGLLPAARMAGTGMVSGPWARFDPAGIAGDVGAGKVVFVDVTARWCLTCQVNEAAVIGRDPVASRLTADGVVLMRADWTRPDPAIAAYLAGFGRYGIPFDVVYGPGAPQGVALPELLTSGAVLATLAKAGGGEAE